MNKVCVFCGSSSGSRPEYSEAAKKLGRSIAHSNLGLVYGGAKVGMMGLLADTALEEGAEVNGVMPRFLVEREVAHKKLSKLHIVDTMHERKNKMAGLADGFIALPGGLGTLEEFFEVVTWAQLNVHNKPFGLVNTCGFYDGLLRFLDYAVSERFVRKKHRSMILVHEDPAALLKNLESYKTQAVNKQPDGDR